MADEKISQLSDAGAPQSSDQFVVARSGSSLSMLWSAISAAAGGAVSSVFGRTGAVTAQSGDYTAAQVGALPSTETLDQIATANATAASVAMNSHKLTGLAAGSGNGDSLRYEQLIGLYLLLTGGTMSGAIAMGAHKITGLTNGSASDDAAAFGQIPTALPPNGTAGGDLSGTYPNPAVKAITETSGPTDLTIGTVADGQFLKRSGSTLVSAAVSTGTPIDGWVDDSVDTWTYASGSGGGTATFTISGVDRTAVFTPGTRIKLTQTTVKYFVVASSSFSTNTTVTITAGTDYTLANAAISANFHSYMPSPQGYPMWFSWQPGWTGYSANPASGTYKFMTIGRSCTITYNDNALGTSNSASLGITGVPITAAVASNSFFCAVFNSGSVLTTPGYASLSGTTISVVLNTSGAGFANSGGKAVDGLTIVYQI